ncbi:four-carbon acid sugar kinase family protein [Testudinibacter sp. P27/CKL/0425]
MLVLADDFTGANDTGVQFCKKQAVVDVALNWEDNDNCQQADVTVVNTDSRAPNINDAKQRIKTVLAHYPTDNITLYKKIDSTLRGNIGAELETALEASNRKIALFCPALPNMGRTVQQGVCYVNRQPLAETEFATDPKTPIHSSEVSAILASQTALPILDIHLEILRSQDCLQILNQLAEQHPRCIFCFDAVENEDLSRIADCIAAINEPLYYRRFFRISLLPAGNAVSK